LVCGLRAAGLLMRSINYILASRVRVGKGGPWIRRLIISINHWWRSLRKQIILNLGLSQLVSKLSAARSILSVNARGVSDTAARWAELLPESALVEVFAALLTGHVIQFHLRYLPSDTTV
jgi:hypothetical protein